MKRNLLLLLALLLAICVLVGCSQSETPSASTSPSAQSPGTASQELEPATNDKPYAGTKINLLLPTLVWGDIVVEKLDEFTELTGIKVEVTQVPEDQNSNKIAVESTANSSTLDVICIRPLQEYLQFSQNGWLEPLDSFIESSPDFNFEDFIPSAVGIFQTDGKTYGVPMNTGREVMYYRTDLFDAAGIQPPKTFEELEEAAKKLHDPANNVYGIVCRGQGNAAVTMFSSFLYGYGGTFIEDGKAMINTAEAIEAFEIYGRLLREYGPPGVLNMAWPETMTLFQQGNAAIRIDDEGQVALALDPEKSLVYENVGFAMMPGGPAGAHPYNIASWGVCISPTSQNKEACWEFIKWSMSEEMNLEAQSAGVPMARQSAWDSPEANAAYPQDLLKAVQDSALVGVSVDRPFMINVAAARDIIGTVITDAIEGKDVTVAANAANEELQKLLDSEK